MAATLVNGREYGLSSDVSGSGKKTLIHFKLTDSALRALEEYSKIKAACGQKPSIQFTNNSGVVTIPGQGDGRSFKLTLAKIQGDANGSFDCVQQLQARQSNGLQCLGSMHYKVTTHANSDVYTDTRKKIAFADTESKKACAKEIKMSSRFKGKVVKKVISASQFQSSLAKPSPSSLSSSSSSSMARPSPAGQRVTPPPSRSISPTGGARGVGQSLVSSNGVMKLEGQRGTRATSGVINMPYRDRVIHLLALRSYKKPELLARLMKDGIKEKDRNSVGTILKQVAVLNKDNSHSLAKHAWALVRHDWPYYTDSDKQLLVKNQQQVQDQASASPSVNTADVASPAQKRSIEDIPDFAPSSKKQRIAHNQQQHRAATGSNIVTNTTNTTATGNTTTTTTTPTATSGQNSGHHYRAAMSLASKLSDATANSSPNAENRQGDNSESSPPDYLTEYPEIEDCVQRRRYKDDFNKLYGEYQRVHERVKRVSQKFRHLKERMVNTPEGTEEFEELYDKVMQEYERHKDDAQFWADKQRLDFMHGKLGHIKRLITSFDRSRHQGGECR